MDSIPKKFLGISNLVFILPDDFVGDIGDAVNILIDYIQSSIHKAKNAEVAEETEPTEIIGNLINHPLKDKLTMKFTFYTFDEKTQTYKGSNHVHKDNNDNLLDYHL